VLRPFQFFQHSGDIVIIAAPWQTERARLHLKSAHWLRLTRLNQAKAEEMVDHYLEGLAAAPYLLLQ